MTVPVPQGRALRLDLAERFLSVLGWDPGEQFTFQTFDDDDQRKDRKLACNFHGTLATCAPFLEQLNATGAGVFVTVCQTDLRGRTAQNVIAPRALFIDSDTGAVPNERFSLAPHLRVKTVQGEHAYWLLDKGESRDDFTAAQKQLIQWFQSDRRIFDLPRVLRIPGFYHCKGAPTLIDQIWTGDLSRRYTIAEVLRAYPKLRLVEPPPARVSSPRVGTGHGVIEGGRNTHLTSIGGTLRTNGAEYPEIFAALMAENATFPEPLVESEVETVARSVSRYEPKIDPALNAELAAALAEREQRPTTAPVVSAAAWMQSLLVDQKGATRSCVSNATIILDNHPSWVGVLGLNVRSAEVVFLKQPPSVEIPGPFPRPFTDQDYTRVGVWLTIAQKLGDVSIPSAILAVAAQHQFDPVVDYLDDVAPRWDGAQRLDHLLPYYCAANDAPLAYLRAAGRRWMIQCVARAMWPGCQGDATLILEGGQGAGKTSFFRTLAGQWMGEHPPREFGQKMQEFIRGPWIIEFGELSSFKRSEIEEIKAFLTLLIDRYRPAYGRTVGNWPRRCAFGGSTNAENGYLVDPTGNRRYFPVRCGTFKLEELARDRDQLWAEAVAAYDAGEQWHPTAEEIPLFLAEQTRRVVRDAIEEEIFRALTAGVRREFSGSAWATGEWAIPPGTKVVTTAEICKHVFSSRDQDPRLQSRVMVAMRKLGWVLDPAGMVWSKP